MSRAVKTVLLVLTGAVLVLAFVYLAMLGWGMVTRAEHTALRGLGAGIMLLVAVGAWSFIAIVRNGFELQRISAAAAAEGIELDVSGLERMPSGRIERGAADALFDEVSAEYQAAPGDWRTNYRLARAYDHAGDRSRAREVMREAMRLRQEEADAVSEEGTRP